jgi:hypothetical protein
MVNQCGQIGRHGLKLLILLVMIFVISEIVNAQEFTSPRATALGSYVAVSDDVFGLDWNASGMAFAESRVQISLTNFSASEHVLESFNDYGLLVRFRHRHALALRKTPDFATAVGFQKFPVPESLEDVISYDLLFFLLYEQDWAVGYAFKFSDRLAFGAEARRLKYGNNLRSSSRFWSFGFSAMYVLNDRLRIGVVSRNTLRHHYRKHIDRIIFQVPGEPDVTISPINFDDLENVITKPQWRLDLGVAARPARNLLLSVDAYTDGGFGAGLEWEPWKGFFLRQGISRKSDGLFDAQKIFSFVPGIGWRYGIAAFDLAVYLDKALRDPAHDVNEIGEFVITPADYNTVVLFSALFHVK